MKKILSIIIIILITFWNQVSALTWNLDLSNQSATSPGSSTSIISVSTWSITQYINENNDSETIGNYFKWYYYDSLFWFFKLDWSPTLTNNVRVIASTDKCSSGYWYKIWWYAYSEYSGLIDFDYSNDIFVYYCDSDSKLHWFAYSENNWFQNFEWISLSLVSVTSNIPSIFQNTWDPFFVNNNTMLLQNKNDIFTNVIQWQVNNVEVAKETIFYVLKQK